MAAHAGALGIPVPVVAFAPPPLNPWDDGFSRLVRDAYARPFLAFHVRQGGRHRIFAHPGRVGSLSPEACGALAAHEVAHAADWLYHASHAVLERAVPMRVHAWLEDRLRPLREGFAERVATFLSGSEPLARLHHEAGALLGASPVPLRSLRAGLPPSLRLAQWLRRAPSTVRGGVTPP